MKITTPAVYLAVASILSFSSAHATSLDVQAALDLYRQSQADQCQKKKIQVQLFIAHQRHDQDKLGALGPELEAINKRIKPTEDKLNTLKAKFKQNPDDVGAYETGLLNLGNCE